MRTNEQIRVPSVRVIDHVGQQVGVIPTSQALDMARQEGLDLVEVAPRENPPVCKILDYGKWRYQQQKKEQQTRKKQHAHELKEIRLRPKTDRHDLEIKLTHAKEFFDDGYKVQFTMIFRGRERLHQDIGREIFNNIAQKLDEIAKVEHHARFEGRRMIMILAPKPKKASGSKPSTGSKGSQETEKPGKAEAQAGTVAEASNSSNNDVETIDNVNVADDQVGVGEE
jgi:translation initiation factor IF-3